MLALSEVETDSDSATLADSLVPTDRDSLRLSNLEAEALVYALVIRLSEMLSDILSDSAVLVSSDVFSDCDADSEILVLAESEFSVCSERLPLSDRDPSLFAATVLMDAEADSSVLVEAEADPDYDADALSFASYNSESLSDWLTEADSESLSDALSLSFLFERLSELTVLRAAETD